MAKQDAPVSSGAAPLDARRAWLVFTVVYLASAVAPFNQAKVPPLIPVLIEDLGLSLFEAGLLMSVFSFTGMIMALPAGLLFRRFGPVATGVFSVGCTALGAFMGALAPSGQWLLASRLVEGIGMGMTAVLALVTIAAWFPSAQRGMPLGVFTTWIPVGNFVMLLLAPPIYEALGWRAVWIVGGVAALLCAAAYAIVVGLPEYSAVTGGQKPAAWYHGMLNPQAWLLSLAFACFQAGRVGFVTWAPKYLVDEAGFGLGAASQFTSINLIVTIPAALAVGWVLGRVNSWRKSYSLAFLLLIPGWGVIFQVDPAWILLPILFTGAVTALIPTAVNGAAPETARDPRDVGPAVGIVAIGRNGGQVIGPAVLAAVLQAGAGWDGVSIALVIMTVFGLVAGWLVRVR